MYSESGGKKNLNIFILKILEDYSDENNLLTQQDIINELDRIGMSCERHTVKSNLDALREIGYKIISTSKGSYLEKDSFNDAELRILIDSVLFSKNVSQGDKKSLLEKLRGMANNYSNKKFSHVADVSKLFNSENDEMLDALDVINDAIKDGKKIQFIYNKYGTDFKLHPRREEPYKVSPYQLAVTNGRYYLIGNYDKYNDLSHYRVDRITGAKILDEPVKPKKQIEGLIQGQFNLSDHMAEHIYMYSGESVRVTFVADAELMDELVDWFGKKFTVIKISEEKIRVKVKCNEHAMIFWALQYGKKIVIEKPQTLIDSVKAIAKKIVADYEN